MTCERTQYRSHQETLRTLEPELLEEFLRAAKGMEAFCSPSQLRDMEFYTQCVRTQWEVGTNWGGRRECLTHLLVSHVGLYL